MSDLGSAFEATLSGARENHERAWAELYRIYFPKVLGYLRARRVPDPDDVAGEVFLQVVRDLQRFEGDESAFTAWIFTIAHHRMLDGIRYRSRRPEEPRDRLPEPAPGDAEQDALATLEERRILDTLAVLSRNQQAVVLLRLFGGLTAPQVAKILGKTIGAVKSLQHRAFELLRDELAPSAGPPTTPPDTDSGLRDAMQKETR
ncbi:MAG TPA: sigma-70 family RNA polymerase sigma factor [Actinomycetota bacterium]